MGNKIISISREYASGGRTIGQLVSDKLNIPYYDTWIIQETMKSTGFSEELIEKAEQSVTNSFLFNLVMGINPERNYMEQIYETEKRIISEIISKGPCLIVGRSANFIAEDALKVFIYSDYKHRIAYAMEHYGLAEADAKDKIERSDKERALHSKNFYDSVWGGRQNYNIMLNTAGNSLERCAEIIVQMYKFSE